MLLLDREISDQFLLIFPLGVQRYLRLIKTLGAFYLGGSGLRSEPCILSLDELHLAQRPLAYKACVHLTRLERCSFKKISFLPDVF